MAHNLEISDGIASAFFHKLPAWHSLGTVLDYAPTAADALSQAHLDRPRSKRPVLIPSYTHPGQFLADPDHCAIVRDDDERTHGIVGKDFVIHQPLECFDWADGVAGQGLTYEAAGSLDGGRRLWLLGRIQDGTIEPVPGDPTEPYLLVTTSYDGHGATTALLTTTRVVCQNTLRVALSNGADGAFKVRHSGTLDSKAHAAQSALRLARAATARTEATLKRLAALPLSAGQWESFLGNLIPAESSRSENIRATLTGIFQELPERESQPVIAGTRYAALQAVTAYTTWARGTRSVDGKSAEEQRLTSSWFGDSAALNSRALALLSA